MSDPYIWRDPARDAEDADFVRAARESLAIERQAYAAADARAEKMRQQRNRALRIADGLADICRGLLRRNT